jgi:hypothetical protein
VQGDGSEEAIPPFRKTRSRVLHGTVAAQHAVIPGAGEVGLDGHTLTSRTFVDLATAQEEVLSETDFVVRLRGRKADFAATPASRPSAARPR